MSNIDTEWQTEGEPIILEEFCILLKTFFCKHLKASTDENFGAALIVFNKNRMKRKKR